jgi:hypothetical protein
MVPAIMTTQTFSHPDVERHIQELQRELAEYARTQGKHDAKELKLSEPAFKVKV